MESSSGRWSRGRQQQQQQLAGEEGWRLHQRHHVLMRLTWQAFASAGAQRNVTVVLSSGQKTYPLLAPADAVRVEVRGKGRPPRLQHCCWLPWRVVALGGVEGGYCLHTYT